MGNLTCGFQIDSDKFDKLCKATEDTYFDPVNGVGWYHLTSTLLKVFKRSKVILDQCILQFGMTSEKASEVNNKNLRKFRMNHARKTRRRMGCMMYLQKKNSATPKKNCQKKY